MSIYPAAVSAVSGDVAVPGDGSQTQPYYDWKASGRKVIPLEELALRQRMMELFANSRQSLGRRMMGRKLREDGFGRYRVRRLMKALDLVVKLKRKYKVTTDSKHRLPVAEKVLNRAFSPGAANQAWGTDITYLWTREGWIYLAVVIDLFSRRVVGWSMDRRMKKTLVPKPIAFSDSQAPIQDFSR